MGGPGPVQATGPDHTDIVFVALSVNFNIKYSVLTAGRLHQADDREIIKGQWKSSLGKISNAAYDFSVGFTVNPNFTNIYKQLRIISWD